MRTDDIPVFDPVPAREIQHRIQTLKTGLAAAGLDSVLLMHKPDLYYFSGTAQDAYLYVATDRAPLLLVRRYLPRARAESGIPDIVPITSVSDIPGRILDFHGRLPETMGIAFDVVPVRDYR
ncbi:MAG: aminopeptidase P family N-terminal domain-containing protein, partial [Desulfobacterales bacterium]|nr:aminopeptidase P family N-terminal domain-containing protein [Desulfobacterales bacterium]